MRSAVLPLIAGALLTAAGSYPVPPKDERGRAGAPCRDNEAGPAARVIVDGLKDRRGTIMLELYPANDDDFLAPDKVLIADGKPFRRISAALPADGPVSLCIRAPRAGHYALTLFHDRDDNGKFGFMGDGVGFPNNPKLGRSKPPADAATIRIGPGVISTRIILNYRRGFGFRPIGGQS